MGKYIGVNDVTLHKFKNTKQIKKKKRFITSKGVKRNLNNEHNSRSVVGAGKPSDLKTYSYKKGTPIKIQPTLTRKSNDKNLTTSEISNVDSLSSNVKLWHSYDFYFHITDEIALEGLEGITIEGLWTRLDICFNSTIEFTQSIQNAMWNLICKSECIDFYVIPEPRPSLVVLNRFDLMKADEAVSMDVEKNIIPNIYKYRPITNEEGIQGSCEHYHTRVKCDEVRLMSLEKVNEEYGNKLVMVASQKRRYKALFNEATDPIAELNDIEYCLLEMIGRSRYVGEWTNRSQSSLSSVVPDPRSLFHYRKTLVNFNLVTKQRFYLKDSQQDTVKQGRLLHLPRFYRHFKTKYLMLAEQIINYMKEKPNNHIKYSDIRDMFPSSIMPTVSKVLKSNEFRNHVETDLLVKYREFYPNAAIKEWKCLGNNKEKHIRTLKLKNPNINLSAIWNQSDDSDKEDQVEEYNVGHKVINSEVLKEVYTYILSRGKEGATNQDVVQHCQIEFYTMRLITRRLLGKKLIYSIKEDNGKLRIIRNIATCVDKNIKVNLIPPKPPERVPSVLAKIKARQLQALQNARPEKIYTLEQAELNKITIEDNTFQMIRIFEIPSEIKLKPFIIKIKDATENKMTIDNIPKFLKKGKFFKINLSYKQFINMVKPNINDVIAEYYEPNEHYKFDINFYCSESKKFDKVTKTFLLQLVLKDIDKKKSAEFYLDCIHESLERKVNFYELLNKKISYTLSRTDVTTTPTVNITSITDDARKLKVNYMGLNPTILYEEVDNNVKVVLQMSTLPKSYMLENAVYISKGDETDRLKSRIKLILDMVKKEKIVEDACKLVRYIQDKELEEGYDKKVDRKSVSRIFKKLVDEGYLKVYKLTMSNDNTTKTQTFLCDLDVGANHTMIKNCKNQFKLKFFMMINKKRPATTEVAEPPSKKPPSRFSAFNVDDVKASIEQFNKASEEDVIKIGAKANRYIGKTYGFRPKFVRMQVAHEFLHYLVYFSTATTPLDVVTIEELFQTHKISMTTQDIENLPSMYVNEISWKSFIRPLPVHKGWSTGWTLVADVILRMPISVFVKLHNISYYESELVDILNHPVKRHFLVSNLSQNIRRIIFYNRKYLQNFHGIFCQLAFAGLLQFGPEKNKERDQIFIYLNKKASLYDTSSSESGYNKVSKKVYPKVNFVFTSQDHIDNYWYNLWTICMNTKLGARNIMIGKYITYLDVSVKPELNKALKTQTNDTAKKLDNGELPGDRKGAGGLDSNLWPHISRNWQWSNKVKKSDSLNHLNILKTEKFDSILTQTVPFDQLKSNIIKKEHGKVVSRKNTRCGPPVKTSKTRSKIVKKFECRRVKKPVSFDPVDKILRKKLGKFRVKWDEHEDNILYVNKAVLLFVCPKYPKKNYIPYTIQRDILHIVNAKSKNKSSASVKRRMMILSREDPQFRSLEVNYLNLLKIVPIERYFKHIVYDLSKNGLLNITEKEVITMYVFIMFYVTKNLEKIKALLLGTSTQFNQLNQDHLIDIENNFVYFDECFNGTCTYKEPEDEEGIRKELVKSIIHSNLGFQGYQTAWAYQLFRTYQKYPDNVLNTAVQELKQNQLITLKPSSLKKDKKRRWNQPFQLSSYYIYMQACTYGVQTVQESFKSFVSSLNKVERLHFSISVLENKMYGQMLCYNEINTFWKNSNFIFSIPKYSQILDPSIEDHSEVVHELALRQQIKMQRVIDGQSDHENSRSQQSSKLSTSISSTEEDLPPPTKLIESTTDVPKPRTESPLNFTLDDDGGSEETTKSKETISKLKSWLTDCMDRDLERRSPSPEFLEFEDRTDNMEDECLDLSMPSKKVENKEVVVEEQLKEDSKIPTIDNGNNVEDIEEVLLINPDVVPTLDEIKMAMMDSSTNKPSSIPHISELSALLNKDAFPERDLDDETLENLKRHFIPQFPQIVDIFINNIDEFKSHYLVDLFMCQNKNRRIWENLQRKLCIEEPNLNDLSRKLTELGGSHMDVAIMDEIIKFILDKNINGATAEELKSSFQADNLDLNIIINFLIDESVILRNGVCKFKFIHHSFKIVWLMDSFKLSDEDQKLIETNQERLKEEKDAIESQLQPINPLKVHIMPWIKVDGTFNIHVFKKWLCCVLSYSVDYPKTSLTSMFEKYSYIRPVDLYWLVELLQEIGCLEVFVYVEDIDLDIFSECCIASTRQATILDNFDDIYIDAYSVSMITLGSFFTVLSE